VRQIAAHHFTPGKVTAALLADFEKMVRMAPDQVDLLTAA
jgi:hypothetical protein